jgi:hypothetical protein
MNDDNVEANSDEEVVLLDADEMKLVEDTKHYVANQLKGIITEEQVVRICVDSDFNRKSINRALAAYETDKKYAGMEAYEWGVQLSRTDKQIAVKTKIDN